MNDRKIDKKHIRRSFVRSIETYKEHASVQEQIAKKLAQELAKVGKTEFKKVLEVGCGPAVLTEIFFKTYRARRYYANDIVKEYGKLVESVNEVVEFLEGDIEHLKLPKELDLVMSASTFQWLHNLEELLHKIHKTLSVDSVFAFSSFGPENYSEIRQIEGNSLHYLSFQDHKKLLAEKFEILWSKEERITQYFDDPLHVLKHMKHTGVNGISSRLWTKTDLKHFKKEYANAFGTELGVSLSYHPVYFITKPKK